MKLRILYGRKARGGQRNGLKAGRSGIAKLSDAEFRKRIKSVPQSAGLAEWRHRRNIRKLMLLMRRGDLSQSHKVVIKQGLRACQIMDSFLPERSKKWQFSWRRDEIRSIKLSEFSLLDKPIETLENIKKIVEAESCCKSFTIDFLDDHVLDISPYMVFGLMQQNMLPVVQGGKITSRLQEVIHAVDLNKFLGMAHFKGVRGLGVYPFKLRQRRAPGKSRRDNVIDAVTTEERVASLAAKTINDWLGKLRPSFMLSNTSNANVMALVGEVLDNAKRHSDPKTMDGSWAIAGFMELRKRPDGSRAYVCHLAIISPGASIYHSLQHAPQDTQDSVRRYAEKHKPLLGTMKKYDEEALWTACSLQDGVSRVPLSDRGSPGGFGMMTLVELMNSLGASSRLEEQPRLTVISGTSCVMVRDEFRVPTTLDSGHRVLGFNSENRLDRPPDDSYVFRLPYRFPGTIVALRFYLDPSELIGRSEKDDTDA